MGKFIDTALQLLNEGKTDEAQRELHQMERNWEFLNALRVSLEKSNQDLTIKNNELALASQQVIEERRQTEADNTAVRTGLQLQMASAQVAKSAELEEVVAYNVKLQRENRKLKREVDSLTRQLSLKPVG